MDRNCSGNGRVGVQSLLALAFFPDSDKAKFSERQTFTGNPAPSAALFAKL
jgi:hypothetical protein